MPARNVKFNVADKNDSYFASSVTGASFSLLKNEMSSTAILEGNNKDDLLAHKIIITNNTSTNHSSKTVTLTGKDMDGFDQTEIISLPASSTHVVSTKYFTVLNSVVPSASIGSDTMKIGFDNAFISRTFAFSTYDGQNPAVSVEVVSGTVNYTIKDTLSDPEDRDRGDITMTDITDSDGVNATATSKISFSSIPRAIRLEVSSYSNGAELELHMTQSLSI